ncbi:MAG TPA: long-chain fatty acid--CoA ligase [Propionibacteriaceae bacterium]|nr:long-chain fatty acid--CoA ligase [Propionibacteriaceae bacterium]HPZ49000.1 long-chain fatty acid--CoA ligase [Propionibacteriaceae bacterium]
MERHLGRMLRDAAAEHAARVATRARRGNGWVTKSYARLGHEVDAIARVLVDRGVEPGDRVAIFAVNRPEWSVADFGILTAGAVSVPIYQTSTVDQVRYVLDHAGVTVAFVGGQHEVDHLLSAAGESVRLVVAFDPVTSTDPRVVQLDSLLSDPPSRASAEEIERRLAAGQPEDLASIVYTSGTTADPKGVMLSHGGFVDQIDSLSQFFDITPNDHSLCFLPLAHSFERAWTFCVFANGCLNTYCADPKTVGEVLPIVRPTLLCTVPRLLEKVYSVAHSNAAASPVKQRVFSWALSVGAKVQRTHQRGKRPGAVRNGQLALADRLVLHKIRDAIGGPKNVLACGGAPLRKEIEEFFSAAGVLVCQGYGLTEASPLVTFNSPRGFRFGSTGRVMPGGTVAISDKGEVRYQGPNLMLGYWRDEAASAEVLVDGWLRTGDIGHVDSDGYLHITDRIKDVIVTSGGKNIAPTPIEQALMADPLFEQAILVGDRRPFVTLLVKPSLPDLEALGAKLQLTWQHATELAGHPSVVDEIKKRVAAVSDLRPKHEQIKDLRLLLEEFTLDSGLVTPTLKVKRSEVERRFAALIEDMYAKVTAGGSKG